MGCKDDKDGAQQKYTLQGTNISHPMEWEPHLPNYSLDGIYGIYLILGGFTRIHVFSTTMK